MGKIHQIGEEYYIEFTARGLVYQQKAGNDFMNAQALLQSIEEKIANGEVMTQERQIDLDIFLAEFLKYARAQYHPATVHRLKSTADHFLGFIQTQRPDVKLLSQVTPRVIEDYKSYGVQMRLAKENPLNPKIINLTLLLLREILDYGIKTGFINDNPTLHISFLEMRLLNNNLLTDEDCARVMSSVEQPYHDMFRLMRFTGLRPKELTNLTWQQVNLNRQVIFVRVREVPLMIPAIKILQALFVKVIDHKSLVFTHPGGERFEVRLMQAVFTDACSKAGLSSHGSLMPLRHIFIKKLFEKRVPVLSIGKMSGIFDVAKLMRFAQYIPGASLESEC
ncbi:MAG: tyrosine-type recombinase/integrase [Candidatus Omnitrophica bacterium]|nr:tyrosine-type recombinase/integrase [Candidatus Omnitrophota bacterium]